MNSSLHKNTLLIFLIVFLSWGTVIVLLAPFAHFPDEDSHVRYIRHLRTHLELPRLSNQLSEIPSSVAFHPPLYYLFAAVLFHPSISQDSQILVLRFFSLVQGALVVIILWKCSTLIFSATPAAVILTLAVAVFNPQFVFIHAGIGNIPTTTLTCSLVSFYLIKTMMEHEITWRRNFLLGALLGLAILSRSVAIFLVPPAVAVLFLKTKTRKQFLIYFLALSLCAVLTGGWWYIRNWIQHGDPVLWKVGSVTLGIGFVRQGPLQWSHVLETISFLHASFWAYFGRNEFHAGIWEYAMYLFLEVSALLGIAKIWLNREKDLDFVPASFERSAFFLMVITGFLAVLEIVLVLMKIQSPQGRYLFMAIVPLSVSLGGGMIKNFPQAMRLRWAVLCAAFLFLFGSYLLIRYWLPHV